LKEDEITSALQGFVLAVEARKTELLVAVGVIVAVVIGVAGWRNYTNRNNDEAQMQLSLVTKAFNELGTPAAERFKKVIEEGEKTVSTYGTRPEANLAKYYMAFGHEGLGDTDKAIGLLDDVSSHTQGDIQGMARFATAQIHARHGQQAKAIEIFKDLLEKGGYTKGAVALELARAHESAGQKDEAKTYYDKVITEFAVTPSSPLRSDAESALRRLGFPLPTAPAKNPS
jgi:predicted negative regulator of RcsB-dependent stress response